MNSTESLKSLKTQQETSISFQTSQNLPKVRPILQNSKAEIFNRDILNHLLKAHLKNIPWIRNQDVLISKLKIYQKQWSVGRMSRFLSEFKLNPFESSRLSPGHLFRFIKSLRRLQNTNLGLEFSADRRIPCANRVSSIIKALKNLNSVDLHLIECQDLTNKSLRSMMTQIKSLFQLRTLKIVFGLCLNQGLDHLSRGIRRLNNLRILHLILQDSEKALEDKNVEQLLTEVGKLEGLSEFSLHFEECSKLTGNCLHSIAGCLKKLGSLTKFSFIMSSCQGVPIDEGLNELSQGLESLKILSVLKLYFMFCDGVKDLGLASLGEGIKGLKSLVSFDLVLKGCPNVGNQGLCSVLNQLKNCQMLKRILLNVDRNLDIGDPSLITLGFLVQELRELTDITLYFSSKTEMTEEGFQVLFESLKYLKNLKTLILYSESVGCTDKNLLTLASNMKTWTSLSELTFDFQFSSKITHDGIKAFCIGLQNLGSLSKVRIIFSWDSHEITDELRELLMKLECCREVMYNLEVLKYIV